MKILIREIDLHQQKNRNKFNYYFLVVEFHILVRRNILHDRQRISEGEKEA